MVLHTADNTSLIHRLSPSPKSFHADQLITIEEPQKYLIYSSISNLLPVPPTTSVVSLFNPNRNIYHFPTFIPSGYQMPLKLVCRRSQEVALFYQSSHSPLQASSTKTHKSQAPQSITANASLRTTSTVHHNSTLLKPLWNEEFLWTNKFCRINPQKRQGSKAQSRHTRYVGQVVVQTATTTRILQHQYYYPSSSTVIGTIISDLPW